MSYVKFNQDGKLHGKSFKKDQVSYETKAAKFIAAGVAEEIDYEEHHKTIKNNSITIKDAEKPE